jgi:hypothetical protein
MTSYNDIRHKIAEVIIQSNPWVDDPHARELADSVIDALRMGYETSHMLAIWEGAKRGEMVV